MERIIRFLLIFFMVFAPIMPAFSDVPAMKQTELTDCVKTFPIGYEKLYYLTLAAVNERNYTINEIQTKGGYILFSTGGRQKFLASIIYVSSGKSMLKITSYDDAYNFSAEIPQNIFKYIELNQNKAF